MRDLIWIGLFPIVNFLIIFWQAIRQREPMEEPRRVLAQAEVTISSVATRSTRTSPGGRGRREMRKHERRVRVYRASSRWQPLTRSLG